MVIVQRCNFTAGDSVNNRYTVDDVLGEGSFGKVYSVHDASGTVFALKLLKLWEVPAEIRESLVSRFDMEFETGRISSDYLVHSTDHGIVEGNPYIVMEFCPNGDLVSFAASHPLDMSKVACHVLLGLKALHSCGKVHRDLKPGNVLVKQNGDFALTDFGISGDRNKRMTERNILGKPKQIFGTYAYMPPEQLNPRRDATVLPTTDIFSFGVMMYRLLTGVLPFGELEGEADLVGYLKRGKNGQWDREALRKLRDGREWEKLIEGCLVPDFRKRFQTADDVLTRVPHYNKVARAEQKPKPRIESREDPHDDVANFATKIVNGVLLRVMHGEEYGRVYRLDDMLHGNCSVLLMGRRDDSVFNDIALLEENSSYISRKHCTLELDYDLGTWVIRDGQWDRLNTGGWRKSTNGTYVNSQEVTTAGLPFQPGDIISIGDTKLRAEAY